MWLKALLFSKTRQFIAQSRQGTKFHGDEAEGVDLGDGQLAGDSGCA
jgi:hypothetical protein